MEFHKDLSATSVLGWNMTNMFSQLVIFFIKVSSFHVHVSSTNGTQWTMVPLDKRGKIKKAKEGTPREIRQWNKAVGTGMSLYPSLKVG